MKLYTKLLLLIIFVNFRKLSADCHLAPLRHKNNKLEVKQRLNECYDDLK